MRAREHGAHRDGFAQLFARSRSRRARPMVRSVSHRDRRAMARAADARRRQRTRRSSAMLRPTRRSTRHFRKRPRLNRANELLADLQLYGISGLTVDLSDNPRKQPLPLTVAPAGSADVRMSARPAEDSRINSCSWPSSVARSPRGALHRPRFPSGANASKRPPRSSPRCRAIKPGWRARPFSELAQLAQIQCRDIRLITLRRARPPAFSSSFGDPKKATSCSRERWVFPPHRRCRCACASTSNRFLPALICCALIPPPKAMRRALGDRWVANPQSKTLLEKWWTSDALPDAIEGLAQNGGVTAGSAGRPVHGGVGSQLLDPSRSASSAPAFSR